MMSCWRQVPRAIHIEDAIPKSATGKVQRRMIAQRYAEADSAAKKGPNATNGSASHSREEVQQLVQEAWQSVLSAPPPDNHSSFFSQGASSMDAIAFASILGNSIGNFRTLIWPCQLLSTCMGLPLA